MVKVTNNAWLLFSAHVAGELIPEAMVTARAVLPRAQSVFGYYAVTTDGDATICRPLPWVLRVLEIIH